MKDDFYDRLNRCPICEGTRLEMYKGKEQECTECRGTGKFYKDRR